MQVLQVFVISAVEFDGAVLRYFVDGLARLKLYGKSTYF
jgi:hypothetical protein